MTGVVSKVPGKDMLSQGAVTEQREREGCGRWRDSNSMTLQGSRRASREAEDKARERQVWNPIEKNMSPEKEDSFSGPSGVRGTELTLLRVWSKDKAHATLVFRL